MNSKETLILVADIRGWAFDSVASFVQSLLNDQYDCHIIYSGDYKTSEEFLINLNQYNSIKLIHFFHRGYLTHLLQIIADNGINTNSNIEKLLNIAITISIPDHLFIENESDILKNLPTFRFIDNYYTSSKRLYDIYANIPEYPKPWQVIYDNVLIPDSQIPPDPKIGLASSQLVITWIGNSAWESWYSTIDDYKGLKTVIIPALEQLEHEKIHIKKCIIDKNKRLHSKQEVWDTLKETDILLIASVQEGTPLTLIEAMAFDCAIITTDVGIVREVLPDIQNQFIINRDHPYLTEVIKKLDVDRDLLTKIKQQNFLAYQKIFADKTNLQNLWLSFIDISVKNHNKKQNLQIKQQILRDINLVSKGEAPSIIDKIRSIRLLKKIAQPLLRYYWVRLLARRIITMLYSCSSENDYDNFKNFIIKYQGQQKDIVNSGELGSRNDGATPISNRRALSDNVTNFPSIDYNDIYVIYSSTFPGVANSTKELFDQIIPFPIGKGNILLSYINAYLPNKIITKIAQLIIKTGIKKLVISGGLDVHAQLVEKLHQLKADNYLDIYFLWHGSPAQWVDSHHCQDFYKWLNLYKQNKIKAIITLKKGLEQFLIANGIQSYLLQNFIPSMPEKKVIAIENSKFTIGIWSASSIWIKNLYPQFAAISMLKDKVSCYTNCHFNDNKHACWMMQDVELKVFPKQLPHQELIKLIANTNLTLYITNSECSPMIVLESLSLGVPCLVGPTADIYDDQFLRDMLTVNRVDCPLTIFKAIEKVQQNIDIIRSKLPKFIRKYNKNALALKNYLLTVINNDHNR
ncbi:glycosyltransferase [Rickettsia endosymbiont of Oedothorax gibbosus]|uniref:glycosyltransferase n=1 Tax=Rickettsia endosymbiont of Oedothorax gibbosus TaxID=931099 RepID=UPI002024869C|nr:glycosyltransferase [Rickettsia endosymbiont of Oedothorax gibbosus]